MLPQPSIVAPYIPVITGTSEGGCPIPPRQAASDHRFQGVKIHALITGLVITPSKKITSDDLPRMFGKQDAENGEFCCPEMLFVQHADQVAYCEGYASVAGHNETTRWFLADDVRPVMPTGSLAVQL